MVKWGIVSTIHASTADTLRFAAYHLDAGAHRLYIYLDNPDAASYDILKSHPKIRVQKCDDNFWSKNNKMRPKKHQVRQTHNATHAYRRKREVDWLAHIDVDEFILCDRPISETLSQIAEETFSVRMRPLEQLAQGSGDAFKDFIPSGPFRDLIIDEIYPDYGSALKGGFLSHVAGKVFTRTDFQNISFRIHNIFHKKEMNPQQIENEQMRIAHTHAKPFETWLAHFEYRLSKGAYRADLPPARKNQPSLHEVLSDIFSTQGAQGLKSFYESVAMDTPDLRQRLNRQSMLRIIDLNLDAKLTRHFPNFS